MITALVVLVILISTVLVVSGGVDKKIHEERAADILRRVLLLQNKQRYLEGDVKRVEDKVDRLKVGQYELTEDTSEGQESKITAEQARKQVDDYYIKVYKLIIKDIQEASKNGDRFIVRKNSNINETFTYEACKELLEKQGYEVAINVSPVKDAPGSAHLVPNTEIVVRW